MRRVFAASAALLSLAFFTVAIVASGAQAGQSRPQVTTITLSGWSSGKDEDDLLQSVVDTFNRTHPTIKVNYSIINGDYTTAMTARFAAHNPPDVFYVDSSRRSDVGEAGRDPAAQRVHQEEQVRHEQVLSGPARRLQVREEHLRLPEGLVAARDGDQQVHVREGRDQEVAADLGRARRRRAEARVVECRPRRQADLPAGRLGADARVRVPEQGLAREGAVAGRHGRGELLRRPPQEGPRRDAAPARRRAGPARRSARGRPRSSSRATGCCRT